MRIAQSIFKEVFFLSFGQKFFFPVALLRPLISVNNDFLKFFNFLGTEKIIKKYDFLTRMLWPLCVCWAYASGTGAQAEHTRKELVRMLSIRISFPFSERPFVIEVPTNHAEHTRKELVRMLSTRQALMRMFSIRISSLRVCSACASETKCGLALSKIKIIS